MAEYTEKIGMYHTIFQIFGIAAILMLIISIVLFFVLNIPRVFGDLTGLNAKRTIQQMEEVNQQTGRLVSSRKLQEKNKKNKKKYDSSGEAPVVETMPDQGVLSYSGGQETSVLPLEANGDINAQHSKETGYDSGAAETGLLPETAVDNMAVGAVSEYEGFIVERSVVLIHTQETI
jgi:hypothetical protein